MNIKTEIRETLHKSYKGEYRKEHEEMIIDDVYDLILDYEGEVGETLYDYIKQYQVA